MSAIAPAGNPPLRFSLSSWMFVGLTAALLLYVFRIAIIEMAHTWSTREEYSYGPVIPLLAAFLVWQRKDAVERLPRSGSWAGVGLVVAGLLVHLVGTIATLVVLQQYALIIVVYGIVLSAVGPRVFREISVPLAILLFMIPLPDLLLFNLSSQLQLLSSRIGVWFIRLFGISVHLEGNVIDLGTYQLQVAEACNGLRYLFPLMTLGFVMALFYRDRTWKRVVLVVSSIPLTVLMNSLRIGVIGVMVEHWGVRMAEGFLHEFQGWLVFMLSAALMLGEIVLLSRLGRPGRARSWRDVFSIDLPRRATVPSATVDHAVPGSLIAVTVLAAAYLGAAALLPTFDDAVPGRTTFAYFPEQLAEWRGHPDSIEPVYLKTLKLDDYYLADYSAPGRPPVNLYVSWYRSQAAGRSVHSPRACLPGGGWRVDSLVQQDLPGIPADRQSLPVNRASISLGDQRQVVYYWFPQRGRALTNEYLVKWYLFWDALTRHRTDGAMVRLVSPVAHGESDADVDRRLTSFAALVAPRLDEFVPR